MFIVQIKTEMTSINFNVIINVNSEMKVIFYFFSSPNSTKWTKTSFDPLNPLI